MAALPSWKYRACFHSACLVGRARRVRSVDASVRRRVRFDGGASSNREAVGGDSERNSFRGMTNISEPRERNARDENGAVLNSTRVSALAFVGWCREELDSLEFERSAKKTGYSDVL